MPKHPKSSPTKPKPTRRPPSFNGSSLHRIVYLHQRLSLGQTVTPPAVGKLFDVSSKTITRDLATMRDDLGAPAQWDPVKHTWYYTRPCEMLSLVLLTPAEAFALAMAAHACATWSDAPIDQALKSVLEKLLPLMRGAIAFPLEALDRAIVAPPVATPVELGHLDFLAEAIVNHRALHLGYHKLKAPKPETRVVHPLLLAPLDHGWVLFARDPAAKDPTDDIRTFVLLRITETRHTGQTFDRPRSFDPVEHIRGNLGRYTGKENHEVRLAVDAVAEPYIRERPWQPGQKLTPLPDGRTQLTVWVNNLVDVKMKILRNAEHIEALRPPELRQGVIASLKVALSLYGYEITDQA